MIHLQIQAGAITEHKKVLRDQYLLLIKKINSDPKLTASEKSEARQKALETFETNKKNTYKNLY